MTIDIRGREPREQPPSTDKLQVLKGAASDYGSDGYSIHLIAS